ncbi:MAG: hypothetical protein QOJ13_2000 [Gaiellales bacterium]|nr:hypothetical protein [Gaiellales bacterium]
MGTDLQSDNVRAARVLKNEQAFRDYNDRRVAFELEAVGDERLPLVCECADPDCIRAVELSIDEYETAHATTMRFVVCKGHAFTEFEDVIERYERYDVVDKTKLLTESA